MKRNWAGGIFRAVLVLFFAATIGYEVITEEKTLKFLFSWDNGLYFGLKIILIPAASIYLSVRAVNWCRRGFKEPKLNWEEGGNRLAAVFFTLSVIGFFIWIWVSTKDLESAIFSTIILIVPVIIILGALYWIGKGFEKSNDDEYDNEYDE